MRPYKLIPGDDIWYVITFAGHPMGKVPALQMNKAESFVEHANDQFERSCERDRRMAAGREALRICGDATRWRSRKSKARYTRLTMIAANKAGRYV